MASAITGRSFSIETMAFCLLGSTSVCLGLAATALQSEELIRMHSMIIVIVLGFR